jgi:hypothetical protein
VSEAAMGYELIFWRQLTMMSQPSKAIYDSLSENRTVEGLADLPINEILSLVLEAFTNAVKEVSGSKESVVWLSPNEEDSFQLTWSPQHIRVNCHHVQLNEMHRLVKIGATFGCPLYDPQTGERFRLPS